MVCSTPLGFPVLPEVYRMYRGCSASSRPASHSADATTSGRATSSRGREPW